MTHDAPVATERAPVRARIRRILIADAIVLAILVGLYFLSVRPASEPQAELVDGQIIGSRAPAFVLDSPEGQRVDLTQYRGRPVILNFWATWCEPCKAEIPALQAVAQSTTAAVIGVSVADPAEAVMAFRRAVPFDYPVALDSDQAIASAYRVRNLPTTYFLDSGGTIRAAHVGALTEDQARAKLAELRG